MTLLRTKPDRERPRSRPVAVRVSARNPRQVAAGQVLGAGLICFSVWLFLDARQLYSSAVSSPLGVRRSVAMSILRPIARIEEGLSLDRLVNAANVLLSRAPARSHVHDPTIATRSRTPAGSATTATVPPTVPPGPPPLSEPTAAHPLTVLEVGDSLGVDLGYGLTALIGESSRVHFDDDAVVDTGLANTGYYNWPAQLGRELDAEHPGIVVVMLGGNDDQNFVAGKTGVVFGSTSWRLAYGARVAAMMHEATSAGAHVIWVGMPVMASSAFSADMSIVNSVFDQEAHLIPGVTYLSTWKLLAAPNGAYAEYLPNVSGSLVAVREPDGVHIAGPAGAGILADAVARVVADDLGVSIAPEFTPRVPPKSFTPNGAPILGR